eukprot:TRINITY_DN1356_c0_g1_i4.p1 TRINITY_DN1356_c0_g1~~TRINITY_DN1356_c0_g1_i4.p1  ORF type:complete len:647 (-),score=119.45 TRINITY_DN1356_c0_g1_i4:277-2175(-)
MQAPEELAAKFQAAMGNRSCSTQSFEDKFPGVFIRKKKRRDMDRCLSQNSMDSWVSETEQPEEMPTWFMNNPSPPSSPTKKPALPAAPVRHPVDRSMIPVMSMDCLDEANDPVVMNDWHPNAQAVKAPSRTAAKPPGTAVGRLFQNGKTNTIPMTTPMLQPVRRARVAPPESEVSQSSAVSYYPSQGPQPPSPHTPDYPAGLQANSVFVTAGLPTAPLLVPNNQISVRHDTVDTSFPHVAHPAPEPPRPQHWTQHQFHPQPPVHQQEHNIYHANNLEYRAGDDGWPANHAGVFQPTNVHQHHYAQHQNGNGPHTVEVGRQQHNRVQPDRKPQLSRPSTGRGKGAGRGPSGGPVTTSAPPPPLPSHPTSAHVDAPPAAGSGDGAAAAAYMAAAMSGTGNPKDFNFTDVFLAYMTAAKQNQEDPTAAQAFVQQLAQHQQALAKRGGSPDEHEKQAVDPRKYKTRMCRNWETKGHCPYEHTCCFAHGPDELRDLTTNHKLLASIGYFSNIILLSMTNGAKPALPPHCLYQQPAMLKPPETPEDLKRATETLPDGVHFPFQDPMPAALRGLKKEAKAREQSKVAKDPVLPGTVEAEDDDSSKKRSRRRRRGKKDRPDGPEGLTGDATSDPGDDVAA